MDYADKLDMMDDDCDIQGFYIEKQEPLHRDYVIVSFEHSNDMLTFWGERTDNNQPRSYGGYTVDLNTCERYTRKELEEYRKGMETQFPFYDELGNVPRNMLYSHEEVLMTIKQVYSLGFHEKRVMMK